MATKTTKTTKTATDAPKVYKFTSQNKFLSCSGLGVQFINGKASTTSLEVAKALVNIDGVTMLED